MRQNFGSVLVGPMLDFLDNVNSDGILVQAGEVVLTPRETRPYSSINPEEDCATASVVHGVTIYTASGLLDQVTQPSEMAIIVRPFQEWVMRAAERDQPSIRPYLKLVWLEWFSQAFAPLKDVKVGHEDYSYISIEASPMTNISSVDAILAGPVPGEQERELLEIFRSLKIFLERTYGSDR